MLRKLTFSIVAGLALALGFVGGQALADGGEPYVDVPPKPGEDRHPAEMEKNRILCEANNAIACRSYGGAIMSNALAGQLTKTMSAAEAEAMLAKAMIYRSKACDLKAEYVCSELGFAYQYGHSVVIDKSAAYRYFAKACAIEPRYCQNRDELAAFANAAPTKPAASACQQIFADAFTIARGENDADRMFERQRVTLEEKRRIQGAAANAESARFNSFYNDHLVNKCKSMVQLSESSRLAKCESAQTSAIIGYAKQYHEKINNKQNSGCEYALSTIHIYF